MFHHAERIDLHCIRVYSVKPAIGKTTEVPAAINPGHYFYVDGWHTNGNTRKTHLSDYVSQAAAYHLHLVK